MNKTKPIGLLSKGNQSIWMRIRSASGNEEYFPRIVDITKTKIQDKDKQSKLFHSFAKSKNIWICWIDEAAFGCWWRFWPWSRWSSVRFSYQFCFTNEIRGEEVCLKETFTCNQAISLEFVIQTIRFLKNSFRFNRCSISFDLQNRFVWLGTNFVEV